MRERGRERERDCNVMDGCMLLNKIPTIPPIFCNFFFKSCGIVDVAGAAGRKTNHPS